MDDDIEVLDARLRAIEVIVVGLIAALDQKGVLDMREVIDRLGEVEAEARRGNEHAVAIETLRRVRSVLASMAKPRRAP